MDYDNGVTPAQAFRQTNRWIPFAVYGGLLLVAFFTLMSLLVWHVGGVFQKANIQRQYSNTVNSQAYQTSLLTEMQQHVTNITGPGGLAANRTAAPANSPEQAVIRSQELNEVGSLCTESANFVPGIAPGSQAFNAIITANCLAGTPVSAPPLASPVPAGS